MELQVVIKASDVFSVAKDLFSSDSPERGKTEKTIADGITIRYEGTPRRLSASVNDIATIVLIVTLLVKDVVTPLAVNLASRYLYDKLKKPKTESVTIVNNYIQNITIENINQTIINEVSKRKGDKSESS